MHHTFIPARMPNMENNTRFSLFVRELYLRKRVSNRYVSASSRPTGLRLSHEESMIQLPSLLLNASGFAPWHREFDDFSLFVLALSSSFNDFTA